MGHVQGQGLQKASSPSPPNLLYVFPLLRDGQVPFPRQGLTLGPAVLQQGGRRGEVLPVLPGPLTLRAR